MGRFVQRCILCDTEYPHQFNTFCTRCDGFVDVVYDLRSARVRTDGSDLERYFDLLPVQDRGSLIGVGAGDTPCVHARELGRRIGLDRLYLKDETKNPTRTTKDRMAAVVISFFREVGVREFATSSTGNSSTALGHALEANPEFHMHLFVGDQWFSRVNFRDRENITVYQLPGATFVEAFNYAKQYAQEHGIASEGGFFNPARREGLKLAFLEAVEQLPADPHWYIQGVASAMGVWGTYKGAQELRTLGRLQHLPKLLCVQEDTCAPMVHAYDEGSPVMLEHHIVPHPTGIAHALLRGDSRRTYPHLRRIVEESGGAFVSVSKAEILEATEDLRQLEGISACPSGAVPVAAARKLRRTGRIAADELVLANITGAERTGMPTPERFIVLSQWKKCDGRPDRAA